MTYAVINQHGVPCLIDNESRCREYIESYGGLLIRYNLSA